MATIMLQRTHLGPTSTLGRLSSPAGPFCYTLEPHPDRPAHPGYPCIPPGTYALTVEATHNQRLWAPGEAYGFPERWLPHVWGVPGRTGIEMHAGNHAVDTEGCIIVGFTQQEDSVASSRDALVALMRLLGGGGWSILVLGLPVGG